MVVQQPSQPAQMVDNTVIRVVEPSVSEVEPPRDHEQEIQRLRPQPPSPGSTLPQPGLNVPVDRDAPDFAVVDDIGVITTLESYRGWVLLVGRVSGDQKDAIANLQDLYDTLGSNPSLRVLGVAERNNKPEATFPVVFNRGSRLLGMKEGQFALIGTVGKTQLQGSLSDTATVANLRAQLGALGIKESR